MLLVVHALPPSELSGTPLVTHGYARTLGRAGWRVTVLSSLPDAPHWGTVKVVREPAEPFWRAVVAPDYGAGTSWLDAWAVPTAPTGDSSGDVSLDVSRFLERLRPDVVHIVDNVFLPLSLPERATEGGIPVVRTVSAAEDLWPLVAPLVPGSMTGELCPTPLDLDYGADCVMTSTADDTLARFRRTGEPAVDAQRRTRLRELLAIQRARAVHHFRNVYDRVVFASDQFRAYFEQTLPLDPFRTRVVPMGIDPSADVPDGRRQTRNPRALAVSEPVTFLIAANGTPFKGMGAVVAAFTDPVLRGRDDWRLVLAGGGNRKLYGPLLDDPRVRDHGPYDPGDMAALVAAADVGISPSPFETFHRVTREYLTGGLPVVGSRIFGISDVLVDEENGLFFDHAERGSMRDALVRLLDDPDLLERLSAGAVATRIRRTEEEVAELVSIYEEVIYERVPT